MHNSKVHFWLSQMGVLQLLVINLILLLTISQAIPKDEGWKSATATYTKETDGSIITETWRTNWGKGFSQGNIGGIRFQSRQELPSSFCKRRQYREKQKSRQQTKVFDDSSS
ncbi:hypothetical protein V6N13_036616 [Hibiscus sabdariffa]